MTLNGDDIFQLVKSCNSEPAEKARQLNHYPGVDGLQAIDLGAAGGETVVEGLLFAADPADLAVLMAAARAYHTGGGAFTLVDDYGVTWNNVILRRWRPLGPSYQAAGVLGSMIVQPYRAELLHLS